VSDDKSRFILIHKTEPKYEAGEPPTKELIARVGKLLGDLARAGALQGGEGLRASSLGVRVQRSGGRTTLTPGPFTGGNELPAAFTIVQMESLDAAVAFASRQAEALGDAEIDVRPLTEPWDIGMAPRPAGLKSTRYMALRKATPASEAGEPLSAQQREVLTALDDDARRAGQFLTSASLKPSRRGRRYKNTREGLAMTEGPFTETKELIAGYVIVAASSMEEAGEWAERYADVVGANEVDVREIE